MGNYLLFRLYGPLAAWGTIAVGQERPSDAYPGKSAILGLLAAAMGVKRDEEEVHQRMAMAYGFAVRVDAPGLLLRDYHTAQVPPERRKTLHCTRRDELLASELNTILSTREYRCDALYTVALWSKIQQEAPFTLGALAEGLEKPCFTLYLGRKSCPLALPVQVTVLTTENLETAFAQACFKDDVDLKQKLTGKNIDLRMRFNGALLYWETDVDPGNLVPLQTLTRRDYPLSRQRWQFAERSEHQGRLPSLGKEE